MSAQIYNSMNKHLVSRTEFQQHYPQPGPNFNQISGTSGDPGVYALDCEMCSSEKNGRSINEVVKISIVNYRGDVVYNQFVRPRFKVASYNTHIHGIREEQIRNGVTFSAVYNYIQQNFYSNTILVGHSLEHDLMALGLSHEKVADVSLVYPRRYDGQRMSLKDLALKYLGTPIQNGFHNSVEDAKTCMDLMLKKIGRL